MSVFTKHGYPGDTSCAEWLPLRNEATMWGATLLGCGFKPLLFSIWIRTPCTDSLPSCFCCVVGQSIALF